MESTDLSITSESGISIEPEDQRAVESVIQKSGILETLPDCKKIQIRIGSSIDAGTSLADAHEIWLPKYLPKLDQISNLPFRNVDESCPEGLKRILVDCIFEMNPGMGSFYGFQGYVIGLLVDLENSEIWDARGEESR
jgi:hypothetical protein